MYNAKISNRKQIKTYEISDRIGCAAFYLFSICMQPRKVEETSLNNMQGTSRQMTVSMDNQNLNVYDGILLSGGPSLTVWTSYNTRGEKTFGIDITEYVISFIER